MENIDPKPEQDSITGAAEPAFSIATELVKGKRTALLNKPLEILSGIARSGRKRLTSNLLTLSIEDMNLKIMSSRRERILAWSTIPVNPIFFKRGFVADSEGLSDVVRDAVSKKEFKGQHKVMASIPAFHSVYRTLELPNLPEVRPEVAIPQQAKRDFGYSAETNILRWKPIMNKGKRRCFFMVSVPREPVITLIETLKRAGLDVDNVETNTFALSRVVNQSQAIVVSVEQNSIDVFILKDSIPAISRSIFTGKGPKDSESLITRASSALDEIVSFYKERYQDINPLPADIPVYLFGTAILADPGIASGIEASLGRSVSDFNPPVVYPKGFPKTEFAINVGLMLKKL